MGRRTAIAGMVLVVMVAANAAKAQVSFSIGGSRGGGSFTIGGGSGFNGGGYNGGGFNGRIVVGKPAIGMPAPGWKHNRPSRPVYVTPDQVVGYNPWTGAVHTHNTQVNNTAFDYGRNESANNGTRRYVRRPVTDRYGNITGFEEGWVWNNSLTGQEHGELTVTRPNGTGGSSSTTVMRSVGPNAGGKSVTQVSYGQQSTRP